MAQVLLVEDDASDVELIQRAIKQTGLVHSMELARNGSQALDYLLRQGAFPSSSTARQLDLIILDLNLPTVSGLEVLKAIKQDQRLKRIVTVMLTSSQLTTDVQAAYDLGANGYLVKPNRLAKLSELMDRAIQYWLAFNQSPNSAW